MFTAANRNVIKNREENKKIRTSFVKKFRVFFTQILICIINFVQIHPISKSYDFECNLELICTSEFFKKYQNLTSPQGELNLNF